MTRRLVELVSAVALAFAAATAVGSADGTPMQSEPQSPAPPETARHDDASVLHGVRVPDPYRWLEDASAPAVHDWIAAQNAHTERVMSTMPEGVVLNARVRELAITSVTRSEPRLAGGTLFYLEETPPQPQPVLVAERWPSGDPHVLVDLNSAGGATAIADYWPSPSGRYVAYGTAEGGSELTTIEVLDVASGQKLADRLPWAGGGTTPQGLAWDPDEKGFIYVRFSPPAAGAEVQEFDAALAHHVLGQPATADVVVFGEHYSHIAEYRLFTPDGGGPVAVLANAGDGGPADVFLRRGTDWLHVLDAKADVRGAAWVGSELIVASFGGAPRGKLLAVDANGHVSPRLDEREGVVQEVAPIADGFLVVRSWGPDWWVERYSAQATLAGRVPLPATGIAIGGVASESGQPQALIAYSGWNIPLRWDAYDGTAGTLKRMFEVKPAADYSKVEAHRIDATSKDGTTVPVVVLSMSDVTPNGSRPTILYGYGGFDNPIAPRFVGANLAWLERGGVYAYALTRGGNEFGQAWHRQGQKLDKQNVFDDFFAAATALERTRWTDRAHLGILGASNGGLLMGAELTQHPGEFRAVVSMVGIYDVIRHETNFANGKYNVSEYGTVEDADQFKATLAYSPLQHVATAAYPAVLMTTGENDPRVAPWQSRKFTAALQAANTSGRPILLLTRVNAGHGIGAPFSQRVGDAAISLTFFAHELGVAVTPAAPASSAAR
jgi:prolyl oligopeptidase